MSNFLDYNNAWRETYLQPGAKSREWELLIDEPIFNVAHFPFLTPELCSLLIDQAEMHGTWTKKRHEFYPTTDMLLRDMGAYDLWEGLMNDYIHPLAKWFFALEGDKWDKMKIEPFIVKYIPREQPQLNFHHDWAHYSTVMTLNEAFTGGGTYFRRQKQLIKGAPGEISLHPGEVTHKHAARPVLTGTRYVIITFCRNSDYD